MAIPKFRTGQLLIHTPDGMEVIVDSINTKRFIVAKNGQSSGFSDEFTGTYSCTLFDKDGKSTSLVIEESLLAKPSSV